MSGTYIARPGDRRIRDALSNHALGLGGTVDRDVHVAIVQKHRPCQPCAVFAGPGNRCG